jgi:TraG P-loop domain
MILKVMVKNVKLFKKKNGKKKVIQEVNIEPKRESYLDKIALEGFNVPIDIRDRGYQIEQRAGKEYPFRSYILNFGNTSISTGELDTLFRAGALNINFHLSKLTKSQAVNKYKRAVTDEAARAIQMAKDGNDLEYTEAMKARERADQLLQEISDGYNDGFLGTMVVTLFGEDDKTLDNMGMLIQDSVEHNEHSLRPLYNRQRAGWLSSLPLSPNNLNSAVDKRFFDRPSIVATSPFYSSKIPFSGGVPLGENLHNRNMEFINVFAPYLENYSSLIVGASGSGKSFANKYISSSQILLGYRLFSIDPDGENGPICVLMGGKEVEIREGGQNTINPCALTEEEIEHTLPDGRRISQIIVPIGSKIGRLVSFYNKLLDGMNSQEKEEIKKAILDVINLWGITEDPESLYEKEKRPVRQTNGEIVYKKQRKSEFTLSDIYKQLLKNTTKGYNLETLTFEEITEPDAARLLKVLRGYLRDRPDGVIFDGQTQFGGEKIENLLDDIAWVNFNIKAIEGSDIYDIVFYVLTVLGWEYFVKRPSLRKYRKRLKIEEAWRMKHIDGAMLFVEELARRSRKYNAGVDIITQDLKPFLDDPNGQSVVKQATSALFLRIGAMNKEEKEELQSIFNLSEGELDIICRKPSESENDQSKGEGIIRVGGSSAYIKVNVSDEMRGFIDTDPEYLMQNGLMPSIDEIIEIEEEEEVLSQEGVYA